MLADTLTVPTLPSTVHLGTGTTVAMWLAVAALIVIAGRLSNMLKLYAGWLGWLARKDLDIESDQVTGLLERQRATEDDVRALRSALALARSLTLSGEEMSDEAAEQIDAALRSSRGYDA